MLRGIPSVTRDSDCYEELCWLRGSPCYDAACFKTRFAGKLGHAAIVVSPMLDTNCLFSFVIFFTLLYFYFFFPQIGENGTLRVGAIILA